MTYYIYSTLSSDQSYATYKQALDNKGKSIPKVDKSFFVHGQANVLNHKTMVTPRGAVTSFTEDQYQELSQIGAFQRHLEAGYLTVEKMKADPDKVAKNMKGKDGGAQLEEDDFEPEKKPKVNKDSK